LSHAYEILSDENSRRRYDQLLSIGETDYFETSTNIRSDQDKHQPQKERKAYKFRNPFELYQHFLREEKEFLDSSLISPIALALMLIPIGSSKKHCLSCFFFFFFLLKFNFL
jgi:curved DNA-binding protein CbpA